MHHDEPSRKQNVWVNNLKKKKKKHHKFTLAGMTDTCSEKTICETEVEADMDKVIEYPLPYLKAWTINITPRTRHLCEGWSGVLLNFKYQTGQRTGYPFSFKNVSLKKHWVFKLPSYVTSKRPAHCWILLLHVHLCLQHTLLTSSVSARHSTRWSGNKDCTKHSTDNLHTSWAPLPSSAGTPFLSVLFFFKLRPLFLPILILS